MVPDSCKGCGACCSHLSVELIPGKDDVPDYMTEFVKDYAVDVEVMKQRTDGRCIALGKDNICTIYNRRPQVCKDFERGKPECIRSIERVEALAVDPTRDPFMIS